MQLRTASGPLVLALAASACKSFSVPHSQSPVATVPASGAPSFCIVRGDGCAAIGGTAPADPQPLRVTSRVRVDPNDNPPNGRGVLKSLTILDGAKQIFSGECSAANGCAFAGRDHTYVVDLTRQPVLHGDLVTVTATTAGGLVGRTFLLVQKPYSFSGFSAPILLRASGKASGFRLENLAPSVAFGMQRNFESPTVPFVAANALLTVYSLPDESYALSVGGILDAGGYIQVGPTYHTKDKHWYLVVGVRPETLFGLIPRLKPKSGS